MNRRLGTVILLGLPFLPLLALFLGVASGHFFPTPEDGRRGFGVEVVELGLLLFAGLYFLPASLVLTALGGAFLSGGHIALLLLQCALVSLGFWWHAHRRASRTMHS